MAPSRGALLQAALVLACILVTSATDAADTIEVAVPPHDITGEAYLCVQVPLPQRPQRLVAVEPLSEEQLVHHMLLYGETRFCPPAGPATPQTAAEGCCRQASPLYDPQAR